MIKPAATGHYSVTRSSVVHMDFDKVAAWKICGRGIGAHYLTARNKQDTQIEDSHVMSNYLVRNK